MTVPTPIARLAGLVVAAGVSIAGCSTPTPYQPATDGEGYAEQALESDRYRVTFTGNSVTSRETVENYLLYRAAEVTVAHGYDHFVVVDKDTERSTTYYSTGTGYGVGYGWAPYYRGYHRATALGTSTARPSTRYSAHANIVMRNGDKPPDDANAYDAREVVERLGPTIARNRDS